MVASMCSKWVRAVAAGALLLVAASWATPSWAAAPPVPRVKAPSRTVKSVRLIKGLMLSAAIFTALPMHPTFAAAPAETGCTLPETVATVLAQKVDSKHFSKEVPFSYRVAGVGLKMLKPTFVELLGPRVSLDTQGPTAALKIAFSPHVLAPDKVPAVWRVPLAIPADKAAPVVERFSVELGRGKDADWSVIQQQAKLLTPMLDYASLPKDGATTDLMWLLENFAGVPAQKELASCAGAN